MPYTLHVRVRIKGLEMLIFRKILHTYSMDDPLSESDHNLTVCSSLLTLSAWCRLKGRTYLNKPAAESCRFV